MTYKYAATCLFGLERLLGEEIEALGYKKLETMDGRVIFEGGADAAARCNLWLRTAERVFFLVGRCPALTFTQLFDGVKEMAWEEWIGEKDAFPVGGHSVKSALFSIPDCQSIIKKAIVERLKLKYKKTWFEENGVTLATEFLILRDEAMLLIDTTGSALHKRGYRPLTSAAPLRETLAAGLVKLARPREDVLFWDPMCGTGTIATEAAMLMTNTAPGAGRAFSAEKFSFIQAKIWKDAREEASSLKKPDTAFEAYASDIDENAVEIAKACVKRAGMEKYVSVFKKNALEIETGGRRGTVVCNPPYGERMMTAEDAEKLYRDMGAHFKTLGSWQIYVITSCETFERLYGRRADKVRKLYNGMIPCYYYQFFRNNTNKRPDTGDKRI